MKTCPGWRSEGDEGREHMLDKVPHAHSCCVFSGRSETRATQARKERDTSWKDLEEPHGKGAHRCGSFCATLPLQVLVGILAGNENERKLPSSIPKHPR